MADPVTIGLGAMVVGGGINAVSGLASDNAQAAAEFANASYFRKQAEYSQLATQREKDIFENDFDDLIGRQLSGYGKAGVSLSGSPLLLMAQSAERAGNEMDAIEEKGRQNVELALMRAAQADSTAQEISAAAPWKAFGSLLGTAGSMATTIAGARNAAIANKGTAVVNNFYSGNVPTRGM